ncbi:uncharacterized protein V6R79_015715 [Siganus canaliculatus]
MNGRALQDDSGPVAVMIAEQTVLMKTDSAISFAERLLLHPVVSSSEDEEEEKTDEYMRPSVQPCFMVIYNYGRTTGRRFQHTPSNPKGAASHSISQCVMNNVDLHNVVEFEVSSVLLSGGLPELLVTLFVVASSSSGFSKAPQPPEGTNRTACVCIYFFPEASRSERAVWTLLLIPVRCQGYENLDGRSHFTVCDFRPLDPGEALLAGLTLLAMGIWVSVDGASFLQLLGPFANQGMQFVNVGFFCIAIGAVLVLLGLLGCCAAHKESKCLLLTFFSVILIIFIAEVAAGVLALAYSSYAEGILLAWATPALQDEYGSDPVVTKIWNTTMTELNCCGFTNYTDFVGSKFATENGGSFPPSCCLTDIAPCSSDEAERSAVQGCFEHMLESLKEHANIVGGIAAGIAVVEITAMAVSMYLYCRLDNRIH